MLESYVEDRCGDHRDDTEAKSVPSVRTDGSGAESGAGAGADADVEAER
jgi:hypothetical protein